VNRTEAKRFAEAWIVDAKALLDAGRWHAAYYLIGYAVECGLKACILAYIDNTGIIFRDKKFAEKCYTHDIEALVKAANLETTRGLDMQANPDLAANWQRVKDWNVDIRYQERGEAEARRLYEAVTDSANGVLPWIKARW
jgi:HEPN domain-containing protein